MFPLIQHSRASQRMRQCVTERVKKDEGLCQLETLDYEETMARPRSDYHGTATPTVGIKNHPYKLEAAIQSTNLVGHAANMLWKIKAKSGINHTSAKKELKVDLILTCR